MRKLVLLTFLITSIFATETNIMLASKINAVILNYANELYNTQKLKEKAKEHYLENLDKYANDFDKFYNEYAIAITELKQELTFFCLLPHKFKNYNTALGTVERTKVCKPVYREYGVVHGDLDQYAIQQGEEVLATYIYIGKLTNEQKLQTDEVSNERYNLVRILNPTELKKTDLIKGMMDPDKIK